MQQRRFVAILASSAVAAASLIGLSPAKAAVSTLTARVDCNAATTTASTASGIVNAGDTLAVTYNNCTGSSTVTGPFTGGLGSSINGTDQVVNYTVSSAATTAGTVLLNISSNSKAFTVIQPSPASAAPAFTASTPGSGTINVAYSYTFTASGFPAPTFTSSGTLPTGLTFTAGVLSGTPTVTGTYTFTVTAANGVGSDAVANVKMTISTIIEKVTICHRTRATTNPYVLITVSVSSVISTSDARNGHADHDTTRKNKVNPTNNTSAGSGPFVATGFTYPANKKWWGDIIPPFSYTGGTYPGLNWSSRWLTPASRDQGGAAGYWMTDADFGNAIDASANDVYDQAVKTCINLAVNPPVASTKSAAVADPAALYKANRDNGATEDEAKSDLEELDPSNPPANINTIVSNYQASVVTNNPTNVTQTSGTLNGTLNTITGATWSSSYFNYYTGSNDPTSTPSTGASGSSSLSRSVDVPGLTCGTTYTYQIVGVDSTGAIYFGDWKTFTTAACGGGGGGGPAPEPTPTPTQTPSVTPTPTPGPTTLNRPPALLPPAPEPSPSASPSPSETRNAPPRGQDPVVLNPIQNIPVPPGEVLDPGTARLVDPDTDQPVTEVRDDEGTWRVNQPSGSVTFIPAPGFAGTATLLFQLNGRSGKLYIQPMSVRVSARSRIAVITGDVPSSISAGVAWVRKHTR